MLYSDIDWSADGLLDGLNEVRDEILGNREARTSTQVQFETCKRAIGIKNARCYSIALNHQKPKNLVDPSAGGHVRGVISDLEAEHLKARQNIVKVLEIHH